MRMPSEANNQGHHFKTLLNIQLHVHLQVTGDEARKPQRERPTVCHRSTSCVYGFSEVLIHAAVNLHSHLISCPIHVSILCEMCTFTPLSTFQPTEFRH